MTQRSKAGEAAGAEAENKAKAARRATAGSFQPGKSGNPGGRPKKTDEERTLDAMCRAKTPEALSVILDIMESGQLERARLAAAQYVLDRAWGKPKESVEHTGANGGPMELVGRIELVAMSAKRAG